MRLREDNIESQQPKPPSNVVPSKKKKSSFSATSVIIIVIVAMFSFIAGNRWTDIISSVGNETNSTSELPADLDYTEVEALYDVLRREFDGVLTEDQILTGLKRGLADSTGDQYTVYLDEEASKEFTDNLNGQFQGIGAELGKNDEGQLIIVAPLDGFPAQAAGVRAQDIIFKIDGEESFNIEIEEAVAKIRGPEGTDVTLTLVRNGEEIEVTITRAQITLASVETEILEGNIGYMQIGRFAEDTTALARAAAEEFKQQGVEKVILDLRNNSGGFLETAVDISELWVSDSLIVEQRQGERVTDEYTSGSTSPFAGMKTVVLVNGGSASASEIVAGALQDYGVATIVGEQTFGKGSVQSLEELRDGGLLKVTIDRWYTPNGRNIDEDGVAPDVEAVLSDEDIESQTDSQRNKAVELLNQ